MHFPYFSIFKQTKNWVSVLNILLRTIQRLPISKQRLLVIIIYNGDSSLLKSWNRPNINDVTQKGFKVQRMLLDYNWNVYSSLLKLWNRTNDVISIGAKFSLWYYCNHPDHWENTGMLFFFQTLTPGLIMDHRNTANLYRIFKWK